MTPEQMQQFAETIAKALEKKKSDDTETEEGPKLKQAGEGASEAKKKEIAEENKLEQKAFATKQANRLQEIRLETELSKLHVDRQARMDNLLKLEQEREKLMKSMQAQNDLSAEAKDIIEAEIKKVDELINKNRDVLNVRKQQTVAQRQGQKAGEDLFRGLANTIGLAKRAQDTFAGKFFKLMNVLKEPGGVKAFFKGMATAMLSVPFALLDKMIQHTIQMIFALDNAQNAFSAVTQQGEKFNQVISDATFKLVPFGITAEEAGKAAQGLYNNFFEFNLIGRESQIAAIALAAKMQKLGVSSTETASMMNFFNKNLRQTTEEALESASRIALMGRNIGISAARMSKDFIAALPKLAVYGSRSEEIFGNIAAAAQRAGVSTKSLLDLAGRFDTFQSAAETVGKLNAILGSQMSATEMLMMTEDQRIETLILQVQASGMAFRDMDRFTQKAIAAAAGINDMNEAQRIFGGSMGDYREAQELMEKEAKAQEAVDKAVKAALPAKQKLLIAFNQMVSQYITDAFIARMHEFVDFLVDLTKPGRFQAFLEGLGLTKAQILDTALSWAKYAAAFFVALKIIPAFIGFLVKLRFAQIGSVKATNMSNMAMVRQKRLLLANATNSAALALKFLAIGAAVLAAAYGFKLVIDSISNLANVMKGMGDSAGFLMGIVISLSVAFLGMAVALTFMGGASAAAAGPILAVGAAVLMMGIGLGIAAAGIGFMAAGFALLGDNGTTVALVVAGVGLALLQMAAGMNVSTGAITLFGGAATASAPGLVTLGLVIGGVTLAVSLLFAKMTTMFKALAEFGKAIKGTDKDVSSLGRSFALMAASAVAGNAGLPFIRAQTALAKAKQTKVSIEGLGNLTEGIAETADDMERLIGGGAKLSEIASGIIEIDKALGQGKKRVEIISTLSSVAQMSTTDAGRAVSARAEALTATAEQKQTVEIKNEFKDLKVVLSDGTQLDAYIVSATNKFKRTGNAR